MNVLQRAVADEALSGWMKLQEFLKLADEEQCWDLIQRERKGNKRSMFILRIYGRYNRLRADRERKELVA